jgi:hypothetical protein
MLGIYEQIIIQRGLEKKDIGPKVQKAFDNLFAVARDAFQKDEAPRIVLDASEKSGPAASGAAVANAPFARWSRAASFR